MRVREFIFRYRLFIISFPFFLAIAFLRRSPYWQHGIDLPWQAGLSLAFLPLLPGIIAGQSRWLAVGLMAAVFTPFQSGVIGACLVGIAVIALFDRRAAGVWRSAKRILLPVALYFVFVVVRWVSEWGSVHTPLSMSYTAATQYVAPLAAFVTAWVLSEETPHRGMDALSLLFLAEAAVLLFYPFGIGRPQLLASASNGLLKPVYTLLNLPWTFPWYDPDWNPGSLSIVNYTGIVMIAASVLCLSRWYVRRKWVDLAGWALTFILALTAENTIAAGTAVWAFLITMVLLVVWALLPKRSPMFLRVSFGAAISAFGLVGLLFLVYLGNGRYAETQKGHFYRLAFRTVLERPNRLLFGYGAGAYGSRAALLRIPEDPYRARSFFQQTYGLDRVGEMFPPGDFGKDFAEVRSRPALWVNESQGLIYSGIVPILLENGLIGVLLILIAAYPILHAIAVFSASHGREGRAGAFFALFCLLFLLCLSVFYNYMEIPTIVFLLSFPSFAIFFGLRKAFGYPGLSSSAVPPGAGSMKNFPRG
ncbi:MAG: hypothetical protein QHI48_10700 [Bacteroidota bacterium]|nr:hypothetical protein [Bacteroidota bacterium]